MLIEFIYQIAAACLAQLYLAFPDPNDWSHSTIGMVAVVREKENVAHCGLRLVDITVLSLFFLSNRYPVKVLNIMTHKKRVVWEFVVEA